MILYNWIQKECIVILYTHLYEYSLTTATTSSTTIQLLQPPFGYLSCPGQPAESIIAVTLLQTINAYIHVVTVVTCTK